MTKAEVKQRAEGIKLKVRKGDRVKIISGKDKGEVGYIAHVLRQENKVIVLKENDENPDQPLPLNAAIKHKKSRNPQMEKSARIRIPTPIHVSNVMVLDPKDNTPTRVGRKVDEKAKKLVRYAKRSGQVFKDEPVMEKE
jgi:large subunit ribosomal protein L24